MEELEPEDFVLAEREGNMIGCAALVREMSGEKKFLELHSIAIHPNFRGKGIGTRLMDYLINTLRNPDKPGNPVCELYVRTTAPGFFEKFGFVKLQDAEKLLLWADCKSCEHFGKCSQHAMKYSRV
ncbi:GNAT family N-acetyltransferase [Methanosarcina horonobensis]|nr:GNAT family N-acetyltransferase [Methanosarcina horonobensis]